MISATYTSEKTACFHCGDDCADHSISQSSHYFCCQGCKLVYQIINEQGLDDYYSLQDFPGNSKKAYQSKDYAFLDDPEINESIHTFMEGSSAIVELTLPDIHCSSCIYLLEQLYLFSPGIHSSTIQFSQKKVTIHYDPSQIKTKELVLLLDRIGYPPRLNLNALDKKKTKNNKRLLRQIGIAGFSFGNIMLLSFPEYLGFEKAFLSFSIGYINIALAIPVFFFSGIDYLKSAIVSLKKGILNLDLPIALGMTTLFTKSICDILLGIGEGYLDSMAGFVFFLLIGRWLQSVTYKYLDFERDYTSYFPLHVTRDTAEGAESVSTRSIDKGDVLLVRNEELIPADALLLSSQASIDYSFVTGESDLIHKEKGQKLYAGGKNIGKVIRLQLTKKVEDSYLTKLWNEHIFKKESLSNTSKLINTISKWYTITILVVAVSTGLFWLSEGVPTAINVFSSVLIVACPCALALAIPFTYGNVLRLLSKKGVYLKNLNVIEKLQEIDTIVFDKTGTLTDSKAIEIDFIGNPLNNYQKALIKSTCLCSGHPLSKAIVSYFDGIEVLETSHFEDIVGKGCTATIADQKIRVGSVSFIFESPALSINQNQIHLEINGKVLGYFVATQRKRPGLQHILSTLRSQFQLHLLTGDSKSDLSEYIPFFGPDASLLSSMNPADKMKWIHERQLANHKIMMIGDGLNDAGALKQSDVGLVIADDVNNFSPACDGIFNASNFSALSKTLWYIKQSKWILRGTLVFAFIYNAIGLYFAINNLLSPVIAAILMPLSSITVVIFGVAASSILYALSFKKE